MYIITVIIILISIADLSIAVYTITVIIISNYLITYFSNSIKIYFVSITDLSLVFFITDILYVLTNFITNLHRFVTNDHIIQIMINFIVIFLILHKNFIFSKKFIRHLVSKLSSLRSCLIHIKYFNIYICTL